MGGGLLTFRSTFSALVFGAALTYIQRCIAESYESIKSELRIISSCRWRGAAALSRLKSGSGWSFWERADVCDNFAGGKAAFQVAHKPRIHTMKHVDARTYQAVAHAAAIYVPDLVHETPPLQRQAPSLCFLL